MGEKRYNKLVRDKIIEIIEADNKDAGYRIVSGEEYKEYLIVKLQEEVNEFKEEQNIEELADILEVIEGLLDILRIDWDELFEIKQKKKEDRGGFKKGIILKKVIE